MTHQRTSPCQLALPPQREADDPETLATYSLLGIRLDSGYLAAHVLVDQTCCTCRPKIWQEGFLNTLGHTGRALLQEVPKYAFYMLLKICVLVLLHMFPAAVLNDTSGVGFADMLALLKRALPLISSKKLPTIANLSKFCNCPFTRRFSECLSVTFLQSASMSSCNG